MRLLFLIAITIVVCFSCKREIRPYEIKDSRKYYRLKQVDKDSNIHYSKVITNGK